MPKVGVVLSGCGVYDGAEIHESVITLLALDRAGAEVVCMAPDVDQMHVVDHLTGDVAAGETRNVLVESAPLGAPFDRNRWYALTVEVKGPRITIWLNGQQVIDFEDPFEPFLTGTVGFKVHETQTASFDDLIVTPLY